MDLPNRRYFRKGHAPRVHTHHLHMYGEGHPEFEAYLLFRDYLRAHPPGAKEYEALKRQLAATLSRAQYSDAKGPFVRAVLRGALTAGT